MPGLVEKRPGIFYRKSKAFLHFHEDSSGVHADVRFGVEFERVTPRPHGVVELTQTGQCGPQINLSFQQLRLELRSWFSVYRSI